MSNWNENFFSYCKYINIAFVYKIDNNIDFFETKFYKRFNKENLRRYNILTKVSISKNPFLGNFKIDKDLYLDPSKFIIVWYEFDFVYVKPYAWHKWKYNLFLVSFFRRLNTNHFKFYLLIHKNNSLYKVRLNRNDINTKLEIVAKLKT